MTKYFILTRIKIWKFKSNCITLNHKVLFMSEKEKYLQDLKEIKDMMSRSSKFISLSGLSGISAGVIALIGAFLAYRFVYTDQLFLGYRSITLTQDKALILIGLALAVVTLALAFGVYFTGKAAKQKQQSLWNEQSKRLLINLFIPLITGGLLCLILLSKGFIGMVAPLTLIFYGLALVNASKYTLTEIRSLGLIEIALGLVSIYFIGYGLLFWAIGFGVLHIIYGIVMKIKYGA